MAADGRFSKMLRSSASRRRRSTDASMHARLVDIGVTRLTRTLTYEDQVGSRPRRLEAAAAGCVGACTKKWRTEWVIQREGGYEFSHNVNAKV